MKFTNGDPLTASDVAFTINGVIKGEASEADLSMVREAVATDATHVELYLTKPYNMLLYTLAVLGIVPEKAYGDDYGATPLDRAATCLSSGIKPAGYFEGEPRLLCEEPKMKRVVVAFMEEDAALAAARAGQVDIAFTAAVYSDQEIADYELLACETVDSRGISLPTPQPGGTKEGDSGVAYPVAMR